tara:strand:- start:541 stop:768 length:228 start_codon:yes stop_codon:yes gene_type:complete
MSVLTKNFNVKCEFCNKSIKKKNAHIENVKMLEFVYPKKATFCNSVCSKNYKTYELNAPRKASLCSMCPTPPEAK